MRLLLLYFSIAGFIFSCEPKQEIAQENAQKQQVAEFPKAVMYEIFVQSFVDSDGDSIGDINGMTSKLDYLQDLGIKGIWLMPIMPSPSYHKYDVTDYYGIHPDYGTLEDFKRFMKEAHKRDIKVVIDMIINHSSNLHPWFLNAESGKGAEFRDYFTWATEDEIAKFSSLQKEATGDSYNITQWHEADGNQEKFYGFFTGVMPDLNYDNPKVRAEVIEIGRFWLEDVGVDGFRLDAAKHIYEDSRVTDNQNWWKEYRSALEEINPDIYLVGEVWDKTDFVAPFLHGLPALFNFDLSFSMLESIKRGKSVTAFISGSSWEVDDNLPFEAGYLKNQHIFQSETSDYEDAIFLSNHDQNRILSVLDGDLQKGKLAASILLTMPGTPYIYYGEEIGMLGMKPDPNIREPFLWDKKDEDTLRTQWIEPVFSMDGTVSPLSTQMDDQQSIYHHYKTLIHLRNRSEALTFGELLEANYGNGELISYYRKQGNESLLIVHNLTDAPVDVSIKEKDKKYTKTVFSTHGEKTQNGAFNVQAYSSIILGMDE